MACLCQRQAILPLRTRAFSTSARQAVSIHHRTNLAEDVADIIPSYPYPSHLYRQGQRGLYGGSRIQFGNTSGEENRKRCRRTWQLNVKRKRLFSEALNRTVQLQITTRVLRTIHKFGGLDEYLLGEKPARIKALGETGWWLRWAIMQTDAVKARFAEESEKLMAQLREQYGNAEPSQAVQDGLAMATEEPTTVEVDSFPASTADGGEEVASTNIEVAGENEFSVVSEPSPAMLSNRYRRLTFRVDRGKHVVFNGKAWVSDRTSAKRAAWERDLAKVAAMRQRLKPSEQGSSVLESAGRYLKDSLRNKKLQRGMPPSLVMHRQWLKKNTRELNGMLGQFGKKAGTPSEALLTQTLLHHNQRQIAEAIQKRTKAKAFRR